MKKNKPETKSVAEEKDRVQEDLEETQVQINELKERLARALADYQNLQKRSQQQQSQYIKLANVPLIEKFSVILDHLERAATHLQDPGLTMVVSQFHQIFNDESVEIIDPLGKIFDPLTMECIDKVPGEAEKIIEVAQKGYRLGEYLIRPARVYVGLGTETKN